MPIHSLLIRFLCLAIACASTSIALAQQADSLPPFKADQAPTNFARMWAGFDPQAEPLEVETLHEWEEDGVMLRVVRFHIGVFKGQPAKLAAVYGFPKGGSKLPGLVQIHGGGQFADHKACLMNAKRGYATVSIAWAGRISAPGYAVNADIVKLFWDGKTDDPAYKLTTDWGAVDGYHAPGRNPGNQFPSAKAAEWTLDSVESPRNSGWFLAALAARRALTFMEHQSEVDPDRLGVYGHSMGGKLTVMTAPDPRVKAAAPSCGGVSDRYNDSPLFRSTLGDDVSLRQITCPIIFLSPANDFHGRIGDLPTAVNEIQTDQWRVTCSPHHNHQDTAPYEVATLLWFDQHLKREFTFPKTSATKLQLKTDDGLPTIMVTPDPSKPILSVDVFYTQYGKPGETRFDRENTMHRFWHHANPSRSGEHWSAKLPLVSSDKPLWVYANVRYQLDEPVEGAGYYYGLYRAESFNVSSLLETVTPEQLAVAGVKATRKPTTVIESFADGWEKEWFTYKPEQWGRSTHKLYDATYHAPPGAKLAIDVRATTTNKLVILIDEHATEITLSGEDEWQSIVLSSSDFRNVADEPLPSWQNARKLTISPVERLSAGRGSERVTRIIGKAWQGELPEFRNLRWEVAATQPAGSDQSSILNVFPGSTANFGPLQETKTTVTTEFTPSGSVWDERLNERSVFQAAILREAGPNDSYQLRIGKGGQIYSLRGPFGESVPPSWRAPGGHVSPWNDEVWQFVAVCTKYNGIDATRKADTVPDAFSNSLAKSGYSDTFFIHNSGAYIPGESKLKSLYCPLLAAEIDTETPCYRILNWGLVPQIKTVHRSPLLYYTQVRDIGNGVIELTWIVHNFSDREDIVFDHLNAPWGGTRISSLPLRYVSSPDGELLEREGFLSQHGTVDVRKTGGWNLSCASNAPDAPSLALVYGRDKHLEAELKRKEAGEPYCQTKHSLYRDWRANEGLYQTRWKDWATRPENSFRNFDVCEIIPKLQIVPGSSIWFRSYLVVGKRDEVIRQATDLVDHVDYGLRTFDAESTAMRSVSIASPTAEKSISFEVFTKPVAGTKPLFGIRDIRDGRKVLTTDPYYFVEQEKLSLELPAEHPHHDYYANAVGYSIDKHHSEWESLIGYAYETRPEVGSWQRLSELLDQETFPAAEGFHRDLWVKVVDEPAK